MAVSDIKLKKRLEEKLLWIWNVMVKSTTGLTGIEGKQK